MLFHKKLKDPQPKAVEDPMQFKGLRNKLGGGKSLVPSRYALRTDAGSIAQDNLL